MKNKVLIIGIILGIAIILGITIYFKGIYKNNKSEPTMDKKTSINLNKEETIKSLVEYKIDNTNDSLIITQDVKFNIPSVPSGSTVNFSIAIPYTITINNIEYKGTYCLGDSTSNTIDPNCAYNLEVINLDKYGNITILLKKQ